MVGGEGGGRGGGGGGGGGGALRSHTSLILVFLTRVNDPLSTLSLLYKVKEQV